MNHRSQLKKDMGKLSKDAAESTVNISQLFHILGGNVGSVAGLWSDADTLPILRFLKK